MLKIIIPTTVPFGNTPLSVNGQMRRLQHGKTIEVTADELEALRNSNTRFETVDDASDDATETGDEPERGTGSSPPFNAETLLLETVDTIKEQLDELSTDQLRELLALEQTKGEFARVTLTEPIERKLEQA